ncbi:MAG: endo-1,4-beta-xylanase [Calothrix sp. MO_167.B42]|nr:endo-1,4-beta-xylanase [Calothrix sp. MO_167.B42]
MFNNRITRRRSLWLGLGALATIGMSNKFIHTYYGGNMRALGETNQDFTVVGTASLRQRAAAKGLIYGAAANYETLSVDTGLANSLIQECGMLVPEGELKWGFVQGIRNQFDFTQGDWLANFASTHNMLFRGHTLVWHLVLPEWFDEIVNQQNAEGIFTEHIATVTQHYAGQMHSWDVVNEAIDIDDGRADGLRQAPWLQLLGPDYIELAFRVAAEADPNALLVYNETAFEYDTPRDEARRIAILNLLERLKSRGTPIHGLGIQSHLLGDGKPYFNAQKFRQFLADVASLGLKIFITELDVTDDVLAFDIDNRDRIIAEVYEDYLSTVLDEPAVIAVLTWGLSDKVTWLSDYAPRADSEAVRPLPLNSNFQRKLAWNAIARAFDNAPTR